MQKIDIDKRMKGKRNTNGLDKNPQNRNKGRPMSFKNQFQKFLEHDGTVRIEPENVVEVMKDGGVKINMPKKEMLVLKAIKWAMSNKGSESVKMIQRVVEMFDGKATQKIDQNTTIEGNVDIDKIKEAL